MDTKLKADVTESAVVTELLKRGFNVLRPVGDRLAYDLAIDYKGKFIRLQTTMDRYGHILPNTNKGVGERLDKLVFGDAAIASLKINRLQWVCLSYFAEFIRLDRPRDFC